MLKSCREFLTLYFFFFLWFVNILNAPDSHMVTVILVFLFKIKNLIVGESLFPKEIKKHLKIFIFDLIFKSSLSAFSFVFWSELGLGLKNIYFLKVAGAFRNLTEFKELFIYFNENVYIKKYSGGSFLLIVCFNFAKIKYCYLSAVAILLSIN